MSSCLLWVVVMLHERCVVREGAKGMSLLVCGCCWLMIEPVLLAPYSMPCVNYVENLSKIQSSSPNSSNIQQSRSRSIGQYHPIHSHPTIDILFSIFFSHEDFEYLKRVIHISIMSLEVEEFPIVKARIRVNHSSC